MAQTLELIKKSFSLSFRKVFSTTETIWFSLKIEGGKRNVSLPGRKTATVFKWGSCLFGVVGTFAQWLSKKICLSISSKFNASMVFFVNWQSFFGPDMPRSGLKNPIQNEACTGCRCWERRRSCCSKTNYCGKKENRKGSSCSFLEPMGTRRIISTIGKISTVGLLWLVEKFSREEDMIFRIRSRDSSFWPRKRFFICFCRVNAPVSKKIPFELATGLKTFNKYDLIYEWFYGCFHSCMLCNIGSSMSGNFCEG